ncbi:MAG TPA: DUF3443 family protein [Polyangia bacterium]
MVGPGLRRVDLAGPMALLMGLTAGCSGGGGTGGGSGVGHNPIASPAENVAPLSVDLGLPGIDYVNGLFASVTVCVPGTEECQTIDHVIVDTGSSGLRLLVSVLTLPLPASTDANGVALAACGQFVSNAIWGPLHAADFRIAGEQASQIAIQVIGESPYPMPSDCTGVSANSADTLRANGVLGIGSFLQDCGDPCTKVPGPTSINPGNYYACSSTNPGGCKVAAVPLVRQLTNPVALFSQDNNGTIIELPAIPANGASAVAGALVFGIGTRDNNQLDQAKVLQLDSLGNLWTQYPTDGSQWSAYLDSGTNGIFFLNSRATNIPVCQNYTDFYCPASTKHLAATLLDFTGLVTAPASFSIANAKTLVGSGANSAFNDWGGPSAAPGSGSLSPDMLFAWGLPFYFGRNVFTAIEDQATPVGPGPFVAY